MDSFVKRSVSSSGEVILSFFVFRYTLTAEPAKSAFLVYPRTKSSIKFIWQSRNKERNLYGIPCLPQYPCPL